MSSEEKHKMKINTILNQKCRFWHDSNLEVSFREVDLRIETEIMRMMS